MIIRKKKKKNHLKDKIQILKLKYLKKINLKKKLYLVWKFFKPIILHNN